MRIAVVEDHAAFRRDVVFALNAHPDWCVVAECDNAEDALRLIPPARPNIILLDVVLGMEGDGIRLIAPLKKALPKARVIILTVIEQDTTLARAIQAGAAGYILKRDRQELLAGIEDLLADQVAMSPSVARQLWGFAQKHLLATSPDQHGLTPREWEVLQLGARGRQQGEIARDLGIQTSTVKKHCSHIYDKLAVNSMREAVLKIQGIIDIPRD